MIQHMSTSLPFLSQTTILHIPMSHRVSIPYYVASYLAPSLSSTVVVIHPHPFLRLTFHPEERRSGTPVALYGGIVSATGECLRVPSSTAARKQDLSSAGYGHSLVA